MTASRGRGGSSGTSRQYEGTEPVVDPVPHPWLGQIAALNAEADGLREALRRISELDPERDTEPHSSWTPRKAELFTIAQNMARAALEEFK